MEFLVILTLAKPCDTGGVQQSTTIRTVTADPGSTRAGLLNWTLDQMPAEMRGANILFFCAEPNRLGDLGEGR